MPEAAPTSSPLLNANIARHLAERARLRPGTAALKVPRGRTRAGDIDYLVLDFAALDREVDAWVRRLNQSGVRRGDRTLVMVRQGLPLIAAVFALFRCGAVPVVIDPGMGLKSFLACVTRSQPRALVGIPLAQILSRVCRRAFRSVQARTWASASLTARVAPAAPSQAAPLPEARCREDELAAILFTSGSTGMPKGVCYEHGMFEAQVRLVRETYGIEPGEVDLPLLPIFALFNPALGMTTVVPELDPRRPAAVEPQRIVQAIRQEQVTNSFGSPTLWGKISAHCAANGITLPSLRRVLCAGAAVPATLWERSRTLLPRGRLHSPYGATECLPVASASIDDVTPESVQGACVGRVVPGMEVRVIPIREEPLSTLQGIPPLPPGEIGELIVRGPVVTRLYDALPEATAAAKIPVDGGSRDVWHRLGDCGYLDAAGRLWFCGRKAERVVGASGTLHTEPCEQVFRRHPRVQRCALIGLGDRPAQVPALVVEAAPGNASAAADFAAELRALARTFPHTSEIRHYFFRARFPVDVRHNAKIHRLTLARWAARQPPIDLP